MKRFEDFTGKYSLAKTLKFELIPLNETLDYIMKHGILEQDEHRAESYKEVKKIIDEYHKFFINEALAHCKLIINDNGEKNSLSEYYLYYNIGNKTDAQKKEFETIKTKLRKQLVNCLVKDDRFKTIDKKELIRNDLLNFVSDDYKQTLINEFKDFTTYFTGFHENRKNMYSDEDKSTAIAYRLIHENLPRFVDNILIFEKANSIPELQKDIETLYQDFEAYLNVNNIVEIFNLHYFNDTLTQLGIESYNAIIGGRVDEENNIKIKGLNEYINLYNQKQTDKKARIGKLKPLYKQILSDREAISWLPDEFKSNNEVLENIEKCYNDLNEHVFNKDKEGDHSLKQLLIDLKDYDLSKIYIRNDLQLTDISQKMFGNWGVIQKAIEADFENNKPMKKNDKSEKYEERKSKYFKSFDSFSIAYIND